MGMSKGDTGNMPVCWSLPFAHHILAAHEDRILVDPKMSGSTAGLKARTGGRVASVTTKQGP